MFNKKYIRLNKTKLMLPCLINNKTSKKYSHG